VAAVKSSFDLCGQTPIVIHVLEKRPQNLSTNLGEGKNLEVIEVEFFTNSMGLGTQNRN
jgi:hypothetical protein